MTQWETGPCKVSAILLAAGLGRRMGQDKLLLPFREETLLSCALTLLARLPFHERILVTTERRLAAIKLPGTVRAVCNPCPEEGQSSSLRLGVRAATGQAYMFFMGDQPLLDRDTVLWLLSYADAEHIVYPAVGGVPRMPAIFPAHFRGELLELRGDTGGREVRRAHPDVCLPLKVEDPRPFWDIDTPEDYKKIALEENGLD